MPIPDLDLDVASEQGGSLVGPFDSDFNDTFTNAVAGWWETLCLDDPAVCELGDGSDAFPGSIAGASQPPSIKLAPLVRLQ